MSAPAADGEGVRQTQTGNFPSARGRGGARGGAADSAVRDSDDDDRYRCTRLVLPQGHSSSSASRRESQAESAQQR